MIVVDSLNREWSVKQEAHGRTAEGPIEVVLSRVLSAVGYRQPPVYFCRRSRSWTPSGRVMNQADGFG